MKVVHLSTSDGQGGAARASVRLHDALRRQGIDSTMLVKYKFGSMPHVYGSDTSAGHRYNDVLSILDGLPLLFTDAPRNTLFSPAIMPVFQAARLDRFRPDLVHLHWINGGFVRIETIAKLKVPVVWTLHDMWPFTGGCHYSADCTGYMDSCGNCPILRSSSASDLSRWILNRKCTSWRNMNITVVTPSDWLAGCAARSSLLGGMDIRVIPNPIDTHVFKVAAECRDSLRLSLGLPTDRKLILFGAMDAASEARKGFSYLQSSLRALSSAGWKDNAELVVFGSDTPQYPPDFGMKATYIGTVANDSTLAKLYCAADVFAAPSIQDNLPNTVMESLSCGTPVVAFDVGGMPDMIEHEMNGWLARPFDPDDFAQGLAAILSDPNRAHAMSVRSRSKIEKEFSFERVAARFEQLYGELVR